MEKIEVTKALYREKPTAKLVRIHQGSAHYSAFLQNGVEALFAVPVSDMGDAAFTVEMPGQHLNRWLDVWVG